MSDKERINQLISQNYMIIGFHAEPGIATIKFMHKGGGPPPQGQYVTIDITDDDVIFYAHGIFTS